ncbi:unnamed protein product [Mesocestoides corti]|uniref:Spindle assembly abnormal protein 6 N-terminal domain-containing protein n=1 Tax=Mesocestoides corti TaxID=53468 RepID=A0A3P6HGC2_MESCO|nr:unnamed protein product [Mesocestoides corti]
MYFLFTAKIYACDFQRFVVVYLNVVRIKEQQGLLVEYNAFGQMLIDLLSKCLQEECNLSPRYILKFSESTEPHVLQIVETTDFRRLTHLAINFCAASDEALKAYLVSCIKKIKTNYELALDKCRLAEANLSHQLASSSQMSNELTSKLEDLKESQRREVCDLKNRYETQLEHIISSNEKAIELITTKHSSELKALQETHETEISGLRSKLESQTSALNTGNLREEELKLQLNSLSKNLVDTETILSGLRNENDAQKSEILSLRVKCDQLQSSISHLTTKYENMESMFTVEQKRASFLDSECNSQREQVRVVQEDLQKKAKHVEKLERLLKQQTSEVTKANSIIKQLQKELKTTHNKAKLRGQVATEQEKVLTVKESELEDAQTMVQELQQRLKAEQAKQAQGDFQINELQASLEEAKKTIENNENIISWLNRQISESYTSSWQQRLKSAGITIMPSYMSEKQPPPPQILPSGVAGEHPPINSGLIHLPPLGSVRSASGLPSTTTSSAHLPNSSAAGIPASFTSTTASNVGPSSVTSTSVGSRTFGSSPVVGRGVTANGVSSQPLAPNTPITTVASTRPPTVSSVASNAHRVTPRPPVSSSSSRLTAELAGMSIRSPVNHDRANPLLLRQPTSLQSVPKPTNCLSHASDFDSSLSRQSDGSRGPLHDSHNQPPSFVSSYFPQAAGPN